MQPLAIIAALGTNDRCIGRAGQLPWKLPEDMKRFKALTTGHVAIMGRKTFESLPPKFRPLPERFNVVMTKDPEVLAARHVGERWPDTAVVETLNDAFLAHEVFASDYPDMQFVIGGAEIYKLALPFATHMFLTLVDQDTADGDAFFPRVDFAEWQYVEVREAETFAGRFVDLVRR